MIGINYKGKMTDMHPAWVWRCVARYVVDPFEYVKVDDYLKGKYGRCRPKVIWATVEKITDDIKLIHNKMREWGIHEKHISTVYSGFYYFELVTHFRIKEVDYTIKQEGLIQVGEMASSVAVRKLKLYNSDKELIVKVG